MLLVLGSIALGRMAAAEDDELLREGMRVTGTVIEVAPATLLDSGRVTVEYERHGTVQRAPVSVNLEVDEVAVGDELELVVDPDDPGRFQAPEVGGRASSLGYPLVVGGLTGATLLVLGGVALWRALRWGRILRRHPWRRTTFRYGHTTGGLPRPVLELGTRGRPRYVGVRRAPRWALRHLQVRGTGELVVAGPDDGEQVVAPLSRLELFGVRPPRGARQAERWRAAVPELTDPP